MDIEERKRITQENFRRWTVLCDVLTQKLLDALDGRGFEGKLNEVGQMEVTHLMEKVVEFKKLLNVDLIEPYESKCGRMQVIPVQLARDGLLHIHSIRDAFSKYGVDEMKYGAWSKNIPAEVLRRGHTQGTEPRR